MGQYSTSTQIANKALSFLGVGSIADLNATPDPSDKVLTALQGDYGPSLEMVIRDLNYEISTSFVKPLLLIDQTGIQDPPKEWNYVFYSDPLWLTLRRILSGVYPDSRATEIPHRKIMSMALAAIPITGVTQANPGVVTVAGAQNGQVVKLAAVVGMTQLNGNTYFVSNATATTCQLQSMVDGSNLDTSAFTAYVSGGTMTPLDHQRVYLSIDDPTLVYFEVSVLPPIPFWPADFAVAVAWMLAWQSGTAIVGIDHKDQVDKMETGYIRAKNKASANMAKESKKGIRKLSESTLSRMPRRALRERIWPI